MAKPIPAVISDTRGFLKQSKQTAGMGLADSIPIPELQNCWTKHHLSVIPAGKRWEWQKWKRWDGWADIQERINFEMIIFGTK